MWARSVWQAIPERGVESVEVHPGWYRGFGERGEVETEPFELGGEPAERIATSCPTDVSGRTFCRGGIYLPDQDVTLLAESSSENSRAEVAEILSWVRIVPHLVAVPGFQDTNSGDLRQTTPAEHYRTALELLGLQVETVSREPRTGESIDEGSILEVSPQLTGPNRAR